MAQNDKGHFPRKCARDRGVGMAFCNRVRTFSENCSFCHFVNRKWI